MFDRAPVSSEKHFAADEVQRARDHPAVAFCHDQQGVVRHALVDHAEEFACEIGGAPFSAAGVHIEFIEGIPMHFCEIAARNPLDFDTVA